MAAELGSSLAHFQLGVYYHNRGDSRKEKFHYEVAATWQETKPQDATLIVLRAILETGDELSNIGQLLHQLGDSRAMHALRTFLTKVFSVGNQSTQF